MKRLPIFVVDVFTDTAFRGNPAAVVILDQPLSQMRFQEIAAEMKHSETAFVQRRSGHEFDLRWFTPAMEVPLCGHATVAAAKVLFSEGHTGDVASFHTLSGHLTVKRSGDDLSLDLPMSLPTAGELPAGCLDALGLNLSEVRQTAVASKLLIECSNLEQLTGLQPDFHKLGAVKLAGASTGVIVTCMGPPPFDFTSRYFNPWAGIDEDPVTGAAHAVLAAYWGKRLKKSLMLAHQASARGGILQVKPDFAQNRVILTGRAVIVLAGQILVDGIS